MTDGMLTKTAFSTVMGVDKAQTTRWVRLGMPVAADGTVPAAEAARWVRENVSGHKIRASVGAGQLRAAEVRRWEQQLIATFCLDAEYAAKYAAEALCPLLPPERVRQVVSHMLAKLRADAADSLDSEVARPRGLTSWREEPRFQGDQPHEFAWDELLGKEKLEA